MTMTDRNLAQFVRDLFANAPSLMSIKNQDGYATADPIYEVRHGEQDHRETYTSCMTLEAANKFISSNHHRMINPALYVNSLYRNYEMIALRAFLIRTSEAILRPSPETEEFCEWISMLDKDGSYHHHTSACGAKLGIYLAGGAKKFCEFCGKKIREAKP